MDPLDQFIINIDCPQRSRGTPAHYITVTIKNNAIVGIHNSCEDYYPLEYLEGMNLLGTKFTCYRACKLIKRSLHDSNFINTSFFDPNSILDKLELHIPNPVSKYSIAALIYQSQKQISTKRKNRITTESNKKDSVENIIEKRLKLNLLKLGLDKAIQPESININRFYGSNDYSLTFISNDTYLTTSLVHRVDGQWIIDHEVHYDKILKNSFNFLRNNKRCYFCCKELKRYRSDHHKSKEHINIFNRKFLAWLSSTSSIALKNKITLTHLENRSLKIKPIGVDVKLSSGMTLQ